MLKPSGDKELKETLLTLLNADAKIRFTWNEELADNILKLFEDKSYHIGLPADIEWALNSGDGTYRP
jgi:hypothetical protein